MRRKLQRIIVGILCALLFGQALASKKDNTLVIAWTRGLESLDQYFSTAREAIIISRVLFDTLIDKDPETGEFQPLLARSFKMLDDTSIEFVLRDDVYFHDGSKMTADDVVFTLNWVKQPENKVIHQQNVSWIDSVEKVGEYQVVVHTKYPNPTALDFLAGPLPIYPKNYYEKVGPTGMGIRPIGTGPYRLVDLSPGDTMVLERNPQYFSGGPKGTPQIERIIQRSIPEENTQIIELLNGKVDWIWKLTPDQAVRLGKRTSVTVIDAPTMRIGYLQFDVAGRSGPSPLQQIKVRKAIAHAINRQGIAKRLMGGSADAVHAFCHPIQFGCTDNVTKYEYNPAKAKELLAQAGYPEGLSVKLYSYENRRVVEAILADLAAVGIKAEPVMSSFELLRDKVSAGEVPFTYMAWGSNSISDVAAIVPHFFTGGTSDTVRDERVGAWVREAGGTIDKEKRKALYEKAFQAIADNVYMLPMYSFSINYAMSSELAFEPSTDEIPRFYKARWK